MDITTLALVTVLLLAALSPWWVAGRYSIPARERLPVDELDLPTVVLTLRRGANLFVPAHLRYAGPGVGRSVGARPHRPAAPGPPAGGLGRPAHPLLRRDLRLDRPDLRPRPHHRPGPLRQRADLGGPGDRRRDRGRHRAGDGAAQPHRPVPERRHPPGPGAGRPTANPHRCARRRLPAPPSLRREVRPPRRPPPHPRHGVRGGLRREHPP